MKKTLALFFLAIILLIFFFLTYLSIFGFETDRFNPLLEKKISEGQSDLKINLETLLKEMYSLKIVKIVFLEVKKD